MSNFLLTNRSRWAKWKMITLLWHKVRKFHFQILKAIKIRIKNHISSNQSSRSPPRRKQLSKCPSLRRPATVCEMINSKQHPKAPTRPQSLASKTPPWTASHLCKTKAHQCSTVSAAFQWEKARRHAISARGRIQFILKEPLSRSRRKMKRLRSTGMFY